MAESEEAPPTVSGVVGVTETKDEHVERVQSTQVDPPKGTIEANDVDPAVTASNDEADGHANLDAYRNSRRLSRPSSRLRQSCSTTRSNQEPGIVAPVQEVEESNKKSHEGAPACLIAFTESVEACSQSMQAWSDRQEEKARQRKSAKADAGVVVEEDGNVIEPKGDPWLETKGIIFVVIFILSWVYIVFTWRICVAGIRNESRALISRSTAIGLLVGFHVIWLSTMWTYIRVILTPPGFVRDHVAVTDPPAPPSNAQYGQSITHTNTESISTHPLSSVEQGAASNSEKGQQSHLIPPAEEATDPSLPAIVGPLGAGQIAKADEEKAATLQHDPIESLTPWANHQPPSIGQNDPYPGVPEPMRVPPEVAPLHPSNLYCYRCKRVKPPRAHHCRRCATCVLKMDHHCPWVGGCVGARNHKYFYHFLQWVTMLEVYVFIVNAVVFSRGIQRRSAGGSGWHIDGYMISLFPICAVFILFTTALLITHSYLFMLNLTTIEHLAYDRMKTREEILLSRYLDARKDTSGVKLPFREKLKEKRRMKAKWADQWGNLKSEGNLWWLDDKDRATQRGKTSWYYSIGPNWRQAVGDAWYQSILPFGRAKSDGLFYESNWRFAEGGLWRERREWTSEKEG